MVAPFPAHSRQHTTRLRPNAQPARAQRQVSAAHGPRGSPAARSPENVVEHELVARGLNPSSKLGSSEAPSLSTSTAPSPRPRGQNARPCLARRRSPAPVWVGTPLLGAAAAFWWHGGRETTLSTTPWFLSTTPKTWKTSWPSCRRRTTKQTKRRTWVPTRPRAKRRAGTRATIRPTTKRKGRAALALTKTRVQTKVPAAATRVTGPETANARSRVAARFYFGVDARSQPPPPPYPPCMRPAGLLAERRNLLIHSFLTWAFRLRCGARVLAANRQRRKIARRAGREAPRSREVRPNSCLASRQLACKRIPLVFFFGVDFPFSSWEGVRCGAPTLWRAESHTVPRRGACAGVSAGHGRVLTALCARGVFCVTCATRCQKAQGLDLPKVFDNEFPPQPQMPRVQSPKPQPRGRRPWPRRPRRPRPWPRPGWRRRPRY